MLGRQIVAALAGTAAFIALPLNAMPQSERSYDWRDRHSRADSGPESRLVEKYERFAGSERNSRELVQGLRNDMQVDLSKGGKTTSFTPATRKMGYGNVDKALALAQASLAEHGIRNPTPEQIKAALNGGTVTTKSGQRVTMPGVLKMRASGMGWGEIAHKHGFKLGDVMHRNNGHKHADHKRHDHKHAHHKHDHKHADWRDDKKHHGKPHDHKHADHKRHDHKHAHHRPDHRHADWHDHRKHADAKHHGRPDFHRTKFERPHRPHKVEPPEKLEKPQRPERPERHHRGR